MGIWPPRSSTHVPPSAANHHRRAAPRARIRNLRLWGTRSSPSCVKKLAGVGEEELSGIGERELAGVWEELAGEGGVREHELIGVRDGSSPVWGWRACQCGVGDGELAGVGEEELTGVGVGSSPVWGRRSSSAVPRCACKRREGRETDAARLGETEWYGMK
uniref:Uncharacterized protein n=1 Tax=Oryza meridionalis TaxID=40149 RepID=A0A0E0DZ82_9ORYZ